VYSLFWQRSRPECHRLVVIFAGVAVFLGPLMCPLAAQPGRMPQVGYDICMEGSFLGPLICPQAAQLDRMSQDGYDMILAWKVVV
jgi:hypothetical protein